MLTLIILTMLFGGGSVEIFSRTDIRAVESAVQEPLRAEAAIASMERVNAKLEAMGQQRDAYFETLSEINQRVDAPIDAYDVVIERLWEARRDALDTYVDEIFVLRNNMTRAEWDKSFNAH